jgi:predicted ester cyclase
MTTTAPPTNASNTDLARWTFEMLNEHRVAPLKEQFWTEQSVERFPDRTCRGAEEIGAYFEEAFAAMPDFHMDLIAVAEDGDNVLARWRLTGTHDGPLLGIAPTHKRVEIDGMDHFVIRDRRLVSNFIVFDQMQYARQLGMMPPDGSPGDRALKSLFNARTKLAERLRR